MAKFLIKIFTELLTSIVNSSNHTKCVFLSNQECTTRPTFLNLHPNEYIEGVCYYLFAVNLNRCIRNCNTLNDLSNKVCVPSEIEDSNLSLFNMITIINESKTSTKHISCECKCKFHSNQKCNSNQK